MAETGLSGLELRSTVTDRGELHLNLEEVTAPEPEPDKVSVRVEASPIIKATGEKYLFDPSL